jgi:ferredoxin-NADP reductase/DMSO/TMAO reductase YedYZ heme-binding membrane subunit
MVVSVLWGILLSTRVLKKRDNPGWLLDLHRWMSGTSVVMVFLHMFSLYMDKYAHFSISDLLIPFHSKYTKIASLGAWPVVLGVLCFYILIAVQGSSLMMRRLPRKYWKGIHYSSYALVLVVSFHAGWSGTDVRAIAYRVVAVLLIVLTSIALIVRIVFPKPARTLSAKVEGRRANQLSENLQTMVVTELWEPAEGIRAISLARPDGSALSSWQPGSHITLHLPNGLKRQYSLCGDATEHTSYTVAVLRAPESRGGSEWIHTELHVGMSMEISGPHNHFELEPASEYLFIAGGIGITPMKAMIEGLPARRQWNLLYAGRSRSSMAFADELSRTHGKNVTIHADDEVGGRVNLDEVLAGFKGQVYACGPEPLLNALIERVPSDRLHFERFVAVDRSEEAVAREFMVTLQRSQKTFTVAADETLLDALAAQGSPLISSCGEGVCGTCEVRVLRGTPQHLDSVMSDEDKDSLGVMYPCVSRAESDELVLDI